MLKTKQHGTIVPLDVLLDGVERANKKDSWDYTGGHLNHSHLFNPMFTEEKSFWRSGRIPEKEDEKVRKIKSSFIDFTLKTSLVNEEPTVNSRCVSSPGFKHTLPCTPINTPFASSFVDTRAQTFQESPDQIEGRGSSTKSKEIELPELKLLTYRGSQKTQVQNKEFKFVPAYFTGLTKSDQFNMFLHIDQEILQKQDISKDFHKNIIVESIERKLTKDLLNISHIRPPHFARLQIFSETFENICKDSSIFGNILSKIKASYDLYVECLLDAQCLPQHEILMFEIAGMKKRPVKTEDVEEVMQNVRELENKAFIALEHNDQLRNDLKSELSKVFIGEAVSHEAPLLHSREADPENGQHDVCEINADYGQHRASEAEIFVAKRNEVLRTLMEVNILEENIKKNLTHAINAEATEQYIKDIQTETMKLKSSNDFLQRATKDLDSEIKRVLMKQKFTFDKLEEIQILMTSFLKQQDL